MAYALQGVCDGFLMHDATRIKRNVNVETRLDKRAEHLRLHLPVGSNAYRPAALIQRMCSCGSSS
ncbi:MAG: hypothetical protein V8S72_01140 [Oscillospiraceae bacterium]